MHEVLVNRLGGLSLPRKSVVRLTDRPDMTLDVYRGRKTTIQYNYRCYTFTNVLCQVRKMGTLSWEATVPVLVLNFFSIVNSIGPPVVVSSTSHQRSATSLRCHVPAGSNA